MRKRLPWIHNRKKTEPEIPYEPPIPLGDKSNGEFYYEQTPSERRLRKLILSKCDENARKVGMDRRDFIASTMGMATSLACVNLASGCGSSEDGSQGESPGGGGSRPTDGGYDIPADAMTDDEIADELLTGDEFILDLQTHHIEDEEHWREAHPDGQYVGNLFAINFGGCEFPETWRCVMPDQYIRHIFLESDTTVAVLSGFPAMPISPDGTEGNHPIGNVDMANSRDRVNAAANDTQRMVQHCQVSPNDNWPLQEALMERIRNERGNHGWKVYPPWAPDDTGWWLDDPAIADPFLQKCVDLGEPLVCAHKGFPLPGFNLEYTDPKDVGPAAVNWPDINFVVYHSAYDGVFDAEGNFVREPEYDPNNYVSVNRLVKTVEDHGLKDKNVYAEMGSAWVLNMVDAGAAQHYLGKMLKHIGEDRVVYGSECVWFNSPQNQIEALRRFTISDEFQEQYGYPEFTNEIRRKIFGLNAAKLYGIDPLATRDAIDVSKIAMHRSNVDGELGGRRWMFQPLNGPRTRREFMNLTRWRKHLGVPA